MIEVTTVIEQRTFLIAKILLENEEIKTLAEIAEKLNVSTKTVSRQLSKVEELFNEYSLQLEKKTGAGLIVKGSSVKKFALLELGKKKFRREYTPTERQSIIISTLLSSMEPIKLFALSSLLNVTDSTISNDLDKLEPWFKEQGLRLLRKPGLGVSLLGDERDLRRAIVRYIHEHINDNELLELLQDNLNIESDERLSQVSKFWLNLVGENSWHKLEKLIHSVELELGYQFSDNAFAGLIVHISLTIQRIKNHETIKIDSNSLELLKSKREFDIASNLANKLSNILNIEVPVDEVAYITMHLLGARSRYSTENLSGISMMEDFRLVQIARSIMKAAAKETGRDINKNQSLLAGLVNHLGPSIRRLKMNMEIRNPLLGEMQEHYPELIELAGKCVGKLEEYIGQKLPQAEVAYIAMHLGAALSDSETFRNSVHRVVVACPTGMGTSSLLVSRIKSQFRNINIVDQVPLLTINENYAASMDFEFVISTVPINNPPCKVVVVSAALSREDRLKIEEELTHQNEQFLNSAVIIEPKLSFPEALKKMSEYSQAIIDLLSHCHFKRVSVQNIEEACLKAGELISDDDFSKTKIAETLLQREEKGSTLFAGRHMVLLHCKTEYTKTLALGILQLGEGFSYGNETVKTAIILLAPLDSSEPCIDTIGHIASVLIDRWGFIDLLHEGNSQEIHKELIKIFADFYKAKFNDLIM